MLVDDEQQTDIADESTVEALINGDDAAAADVTPPGPATPAITNQQWFLAASSMGITGVNENNAQAQIAELVRIGVKYDTLIRSNAKKMAIAASLGNMDVFIDSIPHDNALAHLKSSQDIVKAKGLDDPNRRSVATDSLQVPAGKTKAKAKPEGTAPATPEEERADLVDRSMAELRNSGSYGF